MDTLQLQSYFETLIKCVAVSYFTLCMVLHFTTTPKDAIFRPYRQSKLMLTLAFGSMALNLAAWCVLTNGNWDKFNYAIACIDIILFYFEELMLCYSMCHILNNSFLTRKRVMKDASRMCLAAILVLMPLLPRFEHLSRVCLLLAIVVMIENVAELAFLFRKQYKVNRDMLDNYFSSDMHRFVRWTSRSILFLIISWVFALITMFTDVYVNWLFQIYMVSLNMYIAMNFLNFAPQYGHIAQSYKSDSSMEKNICVGNDCHDKAYAAQASGGAETAANNLYQKITAWVESKNFLGTQFTIDELAAALDTNKNYLSYYINERYGMNFSAWVSSLRVEEAKRLMTENPERKLEDIAHQVGFSSPSYFSKVFSQNVGLSPTLWKKGMKE